MRCCCKQQFQPRIVGLEIQIRVEFDGQRKTEAADESKNIRLAGRIGEATEIALHSRNLVWPVGTAVVLGSILKNQSRCFAEPTLGAFNRYPFPCVVAARDDYAWLHLPEQCGDASDVLFVGEDVDGFGCHRTSVPIPIRPGKSRLPLVSEPPHV